MHLICFIKYGEKQMHSEVTAPQDTVLSNSVVDGKDLRNVIIHVLFIDH